MTNQESIIQSYIDGYNQFDIDKMVADFHDDIVFENIQDGQTTLTLSGLGAFRQQAELAKSYFSSRQQHIKSFTHLGDKTEIVIEYRAVLAKDLPNGMKAGQELKLTGKSVFEFAVDKISRLTDIS